MLTFYFFHTYWDLHLIKRSCKIRTKYTINQSEKWTTVQILRSFNKIHERWHFAVEGNERAAFCKNRLCVSARGLCMHALRAYLHARFAALRVTHRSRWLFLLEAVLATKAKWKKQCQDLLSLNDQLDDFIDEEESENTRAKTDGDVSLLEYLSSKEGRA